MDNATTFYFKQKILHFFFKSNPYHHRKDSQVKQKGKHLGPPHHDGSDFNKKAQLNV